jgi:hypothetical protein
MNSKILLLFFAITVLFNTIEVNARRHKYRSRSSDDSDSDESNSNESNSGESRRSSYRSGQKYEVVPVAAPVPLCPYAQLQPESSTWSDPCAARVDAAPVTPPCSQFSGNTPCALPPAVTPPCSHPAGCPTYVQYQPVRSYHDERRRRKQDSSEEDDG